MPFKLALNRVAEFTLSGLDGICQVPCPMVNFIGRRKEVKQLRRALRPGCKVAVTGAVDVDGLGKTELAKAAVYRNRHHFRDGILWADCSQQELTTIVDLWSLAYGLQLPNDDLAAKVAAWRSLISDKETLLIFDGVQLEQEIELFLPPQGRSGVFIITRHADHSALSGVDTLCLNQFTPPEATVLVERVLGREIIREQVTEAVRLFELVGYLPLAISVSLHLARECNWRLDYLSEKLELMDGIENIHRNLRATFEIAWENLPSDLRETFHVLALFNEGPSFSTQALAETLALGEEESYARLHRLAGRSLLTEVSKDRWAMHSLLREFVAAKPLPTEATQMRMARHYEGVARTAQQLYLRGGESILHGLALFDLEWSHIEAGQAWAAACAATNKEATQLCSDYADATAYSLGRRLPFQEQITWLETAIHAAHQLGDGGAEYRHLGNLGNTCIALGKPHRAAELYEQALGIVQEIGDRQGEEIVLVALGSAYSHLEQVEKAIEYYQQALVIAREIGDRRGEGNHLANLGRAYYALEQVEKAIGYYQQALEVARESGDRRNEWDWQHKLGLLYSDQGQIEEATRQYEQALLTAWNIGDWWGERTILRDLGAAYYALGQVEKAVRHYRRALQMAQRACDRRDEKIWLGELGNAYYALGKVKSALKHYQQMLNVVRELGDRQGECIALGNLGIAYHALGQVERAIEHHQQALEIAREISDRQLEGDNLANMGRSYRALGDLVQAQELWQAALSTYGDLESPLADWVRSRLAELGSSSAPPSTKKT